jgi:hypothetical protein
MKDDVVPFMIGVHCFAHKIVGFIKVELGCLLEGP